MLKVNALISFLYVRVYVVTANMSRFAYMPYVQCVFNEICLSRLSAGVANNT